jgi:hypothetical protein
MSLQVRFGRTGADFEYRSGGSSIAKSVGWDFSTLTDGRFHFLTLSVTVDSVALAVDGIDLGTRSLVDGPVDDCSSSDGSCNTYIQQHEAEGDVLVGCVLSAEVTINVDVNP